MKNTYLLKVTGGDYCEASYAILEIGSQERAAVQAARTMLREFGQKHEGWAELTWLGVARAVVLKSLPPEVRLLLGVEEADELLWEVEGDRGSWLTLPAGIDLDHPLLAAVDDGELWKSECEGLRCTLDAVYFEASDKYSSQKVESDDLGAMFIP